MRSLIIAAAALLFLAACQTPSPAPKVTEAQKHYADCLGAEVEKVAKTSATAEAAADSAIAACSKARATVLYEVRVANNDDAETSRAMSDYDDKIRADAIDYVNDLRKE